MYGIVIRAIKMSDIKKLCERFAIEFWRLQKHWQIKVLTDYPIDTPRDLYIEDFAYDVKKLFENVFGECLDDRKKHRCSDGTYVDDPYDCEETTG